MSALEKIVFGLLFEQNNVAVNQDFDFPVVSKRDGDLCVFETDDAIFVARQVDRHAVPENFNIISMRQLVMQVPRDKFELLSKASQLLEWQNNHHFCSRCGHATIPHPQDSFATKCPKCTYTQYPRIQSCIIVLITRGEEMLLARSQRHETMFSLIAGFVEVGETLEQAIVREVKEEVGLEVKNIQYMSSQPWPFPSNLMIGFKAEYAGGELVLEEAEIAEAGFYTKDNLPILPPKGSIAHTIIHHFMDDLAS